MSLRRDFRRWNRSRSKYDKALRAYQFDEEAKNIKESIKNLLNELQVDPKYLTSDTRTLLREWMTDCCKEKVWQMTQSETSSDEIPGEADGVMRQAVNADGEFIEDGILLMENVNQPMSRRSSYR